MTKKWKMKESAVEKTSTYDKKKLAEVAELSTPGERAAELRWLAEQAEATQIEVMQRTAILYRQLRTEGMEFSPELHLGALLRTVKIVHREARALQMKQALDAATAGDVSRRKMDKFRDRKRKKGSPKLQRIKIQFFPLIEKMREENFSWQDVSDYLESEHNFKVTRDYLFKAYEKIKAEYDAGLAALGTTGTDETAPQTEA